KYESVPKRLDEEYHAIKDDTPLVNMYTTREKRRKSKQIARESSTPKTSLKIRIKQKKSTPTTPLPPSDDRERDYIIEANQLSLAEAKTTKVYEEQHNVDAVEKRILEDDVDKLVEAEEYFSGSEFADTMILSDEDFGVRIEPVSHKENPEEIVDDDKKKDDDDDHDDQSLIKTRRTGSSEIKTDQMQTPVPSPLRPNRTDLSSNKTVTKDLTVFDTPMSYVPSQDPTKLTSSLRTHLQGVITRMCKRQATNDLIKDNLSRLVTDAIKKEIESSQADVPALISQEYVAHAPKIIEGIFKIHM
nr:hypothetical protein [Tanacetum cinerariifolium]